MKRILLIMAIGLISVGLYNCGQITEKKSTDAVAKVETAKIMVYYFHSKQRCKTCVAIQNVAEETVTTNFSNNEDVKFAEVDFSEKINEAIAEKYEIASSSLIVVSGDDHVNLTQMAFANALRNPEVLKKALVDEVNKYLTK